MLLSLYAFLTLLVCVCHFSPLVQVVPVSDRGSSSFSFHHCTVGPTTLY